MWPTMRMGDGATRAALPDKGTAPRGRIEAAVANWPTPAARDGDGRGADAARIGTKERHGGWNLDDWAARWPTPTANDWKGSGPTVMRSDGIMRGDRLDYATEIFWSTPRASDGEKGGPGNSRSANLTMEYASSLPAPAMPRAGAPSWTPILAAFRRYRAMTDSSLRAEMRALIRRAIRAARRGERRPWTRPSFRRSLNPIFVADLMGWPDGWTRLASMNSGCSAMGFTRWRRHMRSALLRLGSPPAAPGVQASLFG